LNTILRGRWVVAGPDQALTDGAVAVAGQEIASVGPWPEIRDRYPNATVIGSPDYAVIPGLINAHHHSNGSTAVQHGIEDRLLELWLLSLARRRRASTHLSTLLSAARLLRTGVTAVVDVMSGRGTAEQVEDGVQAALNAYDEAGMRAAVAVGITERSFLAWGEDDAFLASLPPELRRLAETRLPGPDAATPDEYLALIAQLCRQVADNPRLAVWFGPPGPQWVSDSFMARIAEQAAALGTGIQTHLLESYYEKLHGPREYGQSTVLHLQELGVLSPRLSFAHGVWLTEADIEALAASGAHVSHNPSSNLRLRAGVAPLNALRAAGASVALGMDGTTLNDDEDMFTEMRLARNLHRGPRVGEPAPAVADIWRLATEGGAALFQAGHQLGRLAPGYAADAVLVRLDRITWPWVAPEVDPMHLLLTRAAAGDVETVMVNGEIVLQDGQPTRFDVATAAEALADELAATPFPADGADMAEALMPRIAAHYAGWQADPLEPYSARNSRR
jgi:cytosine/adenosine deaminase-related metal-dependent hydrolase